MPCPVHWSMNNWNWWMNVDIDQWTREYGTWGVHFLRKLRSQFTLPIGIHDLKSKNEYICHIYYMLVSNHCLIDQCYEVPWYVPWSMFGARKACGEGLRSAPFGIDYCWYVLEWHVLFICSTCRAPLVWCVLQNMTVEIWQRKPRMSIAFCMKSKHSFRYWKRVARKQLLTTETNASSIWISICLIIDA